MERIVRLVVFAILDKIHLAGALMLFWMTRRKYVTVNISDEQALNRLKLYGYKFNPLWREPLQPLKSNTIDISFIIPIYNTEKYLAKCLDSILNQETVCHYEIICVDDGSTDGSSEILRQYKSRYGEKIKIITQNNSGPSIARNNALQEAGGEYIGFIDSDDWVSGNYVAEMLNIAKETDADIVQSRFITVKLNGHVISDRNLGKRVINPNDFQSVFDYVSGYMGGKLFKKALFTKVRCPERFLYEDMVTRMCLVHLCSCIAFTDASAYYYVQHNTNITKVAVKRNVKVIDQYWLARSLANFALDHLNLNASNTYRILLKEWSSLMYERTSRLPDEVRHSLFCLCCNYLIKRFDIVGIPPEIRYNMIHKAFQSYNYELYILISKSLYYHSKTL